MLCARNVGIGILVIVSYLGSWRGCSAVGRVCLCGDPAWSAQVGDQRPIPWGFRSCGVDDNYDYKHYYNHYYN